MNTVKSRPPEALSKGTNRAWVDMVYGAPIALGVTEDGREYIEQIQFVDGIRVGWRIFRLCAHVTLDVCTFGIWEVIAFPYELYTQKHYLEYSYFVVYDTQNKVVRKIGIDTAEGQKLLKMPWASPLKERELNNRPFTVKRPSVQVRITEMKSESGNHTDGDGKIIKNAQVKEGNSVNEKVHERFNQMKANRAKGIVDPSLFFGDVMGKMVDEQMKKMNLISVMSEEEPSKCEDYSLRGKEFPGTFLFMNRFRLSRISVDVKSRRVVGLFSLQDGRFSESEMVEFSNNFKDTLDEYVFPSDMKGEHIGIKNQHRWNWVAPDNLGDKYQYVLMALCFEGTRFNHYKDEWKVFFGIKRIDGKARNRSDIVESPVDDGTPIESFNYNDRVVSSGSAFCVSTNGYLITNFHVVEKAITNKSYHVAVMYENKLYNASFFKGSDTRNADIALLKINRETLPISIANTNNVHLGQNVFTVGFPVPKVQGFSPKMTRGVISSLNGIKDSENEYQIDVAIQPGNSGGPLVDDAGKLVGIVVARMRDALFYNVTGALPQGINYAVKARFLQELCSNVPEIMTAENYVSHTSYESVVEKVVKSCALVCVYE